MPFIIDKNMRQSCIDYLRKIDSEIYFSQNYDKIYFPVNTHPDIQIHFVDSRTAFVPPELFNYYKNTLPFFIDLKKGTRPLSGTYPGNVAYNVARIGKYAILNKKTVDANILNYYIEKGFTIINVKQGYTKCNICTDGKVAVTEDEGIYSALNENGIKTLKIPAGSVRLEGFDYGFIGGASGSFRDKILFCGEIKNKAIFDQIKSFFKSNDTEIIVIDKEELTDYGSILYFE